MHTPATPQEDCDLRCGKSHVASQAMLISEQQLASAQRESLGASEDPFVDGAVSSLLRNLGVRSVVLVEPFTV